MTDDLIQRAQDALKGVTPESEITMLESEWFCEIGYVDGDGIGRWEKTVESHPFKTLAQAEALRDEWAATGKLYRTHWGELRPTGMNYGAFCIRKGSRILPAPPQLVPDLLARIAAQEAEIKRLRSLALPFVAIRGEQWSRERGLPPNHIAAHFYDMMKDLGARMDDFTRVEMEARHD